MTTAVCSNCSATGRLDDCGSGHGLCLDCVLRCAECRRVLCMMCGTLQCPECQADEPAAAPHRAPAGPPAASAPSPGARPPAHGIQCPVCRTNLPSVAAHCRTCGPVASRHRLETITELRRIVYRLRADAEDGQTQAPGWWSVVRFYSDRLADQTAALVQAVEQARGAIRPPPARAHRPLAEQEHTPTPVEVPVAAPAAPPPSVAQPRTELPGPSPSSPAPALPDTRPPQLRPPPPTAEPRPWAETVIRSLLYIGVFGLAITLFTIIYTYRQKISGGWKLAGVGTTTLAFFGAGALLRGRFDYERTGLAFIMLSGLMLPMNYFAAKLFGVLDATHTWVEWGTVATACCGLYWGVSRKLEDPGLPYLVMLAAMAALMCFATAVLPVWVWRGVGAALVASLGLLALPAIGPRYRVPFLVVSGLFGALGTLVYARSLATLVGMDGPALWRVAILGLSLTVTLQALDLRRDMSAIRHLVPLLLAANLLILLKEFSTGQHNIGFVLAGTAFLLWGQEALWRRAGGDWLRGLLHDRDADEYRESSADACQRVSLAIGVGAVLVLVASVVAHTVPRMASVPVLGKGGALSLWGGLALTGLFSGLRSGRVPEWMLGLCLMALASVWYGAYLVQPDYDAPALSLMVLCAVALFSVGWWSDEARAAMVVDTAVWSFLIAAAGVVVHRTLVLDHAVATTASLLTFATFFATDWARPPRVADNLPVGVATTVSSLSFGAAVLHIWWWAAPVGWTWAVPLLLVALSCAFGAELILMRERTEISHRWYRAGFVAAGVGLALMAVDVLTASQVHLPGLDPSKPASVWTAFALAALFYGLDAARTPSTRSAHALFSLAPVAAWYGAMVFDLTGPSGLLYAMLAGAVIHPRFGSESFWTEPRRRVAATTMAILSPLAYLLFVFVDPQHVAAVGALWLGTLYFAERAAREDEPVFVHLAWVGVFPALAVTALAIGAVEWTASDLTWLVAPVSAIVFAAWAALGPERLGRWFRPGYIVTWAYGLAVAVQLFLEVGVPFWPGLALTGAWVIAAWCGIRHQLEEASALSFVAGLAALLTVRVGLKDSGAAATTVAYSLLPLAAAYATIAAWAARDEDRTTAQWTLFGGQLLLYVVVVFAQVSLLGWREGPLALLALGHAAIHFAAWLYTGLLLLVYTGLALANLALGLALTAWGVAPDTVSLVMQAAAAAQVGASVLVRKRFEDEPVPPFIAIGLGVSAATLLLQVARNVGDLPGSLATIATVFAAAATTALAARLTSERRLLRGTEILAGLGYLLLLLRWDVDQAIAYSAFPGLLLVLHGVRALRAADKNHPDATALDGRARSLLRAGMAVLFIPPLLQAAAPAQGMASFLSGLFAILLLLVAIQLRVRLMFLTCIGVLALVFGIQLVRIIDFGTVPTWVWIGVASVVLIFVGFLSERNFNRAVKGTVTRAGERVKSFFEDWR